MRIGKRIYYDKLTGHIIQDTGEMSGEVILPTVEQDIENYIALKERNRDTFDVIKLEFGAYQQDFIESRGNYRVNPKTKELEFSYPNPNEPETPPVYMKPLTEQIEEVRNDMDTAILELTMVISMSGGAM